MRHLPPLNALRVFDAAARRLNFSAAAEELCVTHSAISHQIRQLEDWLGQPLFVRHSSGVHLTSAGLSLQQANGRALSLLEEACAKLAQTTQTSEIILGAPGSFLANWLIPRLERFENTHPQIRLRLQTSAELTELATRRVDVLIISAKSWPRQVHGGLLSLGCALFRPGQGRSGRRERLTPFFPQPLAARRVPCLDLPPL